MQFRYLKYDLYRYFYFSDDEKEPSLFKKMKTVVFTQGIWATIVYRFRRWLRFECRSRVLKIALTPIGIILGKLMQILTGIMIPPIHDIGPGLYIGHYGSTILGGKFGKMCNVSHQCTIGFGGRGEDFGLPEIGDYVYIAPGAKIFGKIKIGNHVAIGANAVVTKSLEDNAVAVGIPAKVISHKGSHGIVKYKEEKFQTILK